HFGTGAGPDRRGVPARAGAAVAYPAAAARAALAAVRHAVAQPHSWPTRPHAAPAEPGHAVVAAAPPSALPPPPRRPTQSVDSLRHAVRECPLGLYSVGVPRPLPSALADRSALRASRTDGLGPTIGREAIFTLVSRARRQVFERDTDELAGAYANWLGRIVA